MPGTKEKNLYDVLGVEKDASQGAIKKAYHKLALKLHPDKNPGDQEASEKFQSLQRIYAVLGDSDRRKVYDQTGSLEDSEGLSGEQFDNLYDYYRNIYKKVSEEDIEAVETEYRGSEEEKQDVLKYFKDFKGDLDKVFSYVICSDPDRDSHRFMDIIEEEIASGAVKSNKKFKSWAKDVKQRPRPRDPLAKPKRQKKEEDNTSLVAAIRNKASSDFSSLAAAMEQKYGGKPSTEPDEPTEEEFAAARSRMEAKKSKISQNDQPKPKRKKKA